MEEWEKRYIRKNLPGLMKNTKVGAALKAHLISEDVIGDDDVAELNKCGIDENERTLKLYEILMTREDGYGTLMRALKEGNQTGASKILQNLQKGFNKHSVKKKNDVIPSSKAVLMPATNDSTLSNQSQEEEAVPLVQLPTTNCSNPGTNPDIPSDNQMFPMLRKRKVIISGIIFLIILAAAVVVVVAITSVQKKGNTSNSISDIQLQSSKGVGSLTNGSKGTVPSSVPVQFKNSISTSNSTLKAPTSNYKKYTYVTILLAGPLTEFGAPKLIIQLLDRDLTRLDCATRVVLKNSESHSGIVKYEAVGFSRNPTVSSPSCADYDYRLVVLDIPVFPSGSRTMNWEKVDSDTLASLKSYMDQCKKESFCDLFFLGFPLFWVDNTWTARTWTNTDKQRLQKFLTSLRLFSTTTSSKIQNQVLLFESYNNSDKQVASSLKGQISTSILTMADNPFHLVNINPGRSSQPSNFWPFLQNCLPPVSKDKNLVEYSYFEKLRKGDKLYCCYSKQ